MCCLLALATLLVGAVTAVSCGDKGGAPTLPPLPEESSTGGSVSEEISSDESSFEDSSSEEIVIDESKVTLRLATKTYNIEDGQTVTLEVEFSLNGQALSLSYLEFSSSDNAVATVDKNGVVTGISSGKAIITVACGKRVTKATVNVAKRENRLDVSDESAMMLVGDTKQVTAKVHFGLTEVTDAVISWQSSNSAVATVDNGVITAVGSGKAEITVSYEDVSKKVAVTVVAEATAEQVNTFSEEYINVFGRTYMQNGELNLDHAANGVEVGFVGTSLKVEMSSNLKSYMRVYVDGISTGTRLPIEVATKEYTVAEDLEEGCHIVRIVKASEEQYAQWDILGFTADKFCVVPEKSDLKIEFIGSSAAAGFGASGAQGQEGTVDNSDPSKSYAYLTAHELGADYSILAGEGIATTVHFWSPINMETLYEQVSMTNIGRYAFDFTPDIIVMDLGSVESSYISRPHDGDPSYSSQFHEDYQRFLQRVRELNPDAYIICLYGMMNSNATIRLGIQGAVESMQDEKIVYTPFAITANNDGAINHPSATAHKEWADDLVAYIRSLGV